MSDERRYWVCFFLSFSALGGLSWAYVHKINTATAEVSTLVRAQFEVIPQVVSDVQEIKRSISGFDDRLLDIAARLERLENR